VTTGGVISGRVLHGVHASSHAEDSWWLGDPSPRSEGRGQKCAAVQGVRSRLLCCPTLARGVRRRVAGQFVTCICCGCPALTTGSLPERVLLPALCALCLCLLVLLLLLPGACCWSRR